LNLHRTHIDLDGDGDGFNYYKGKTMMMNTHRLQGVSMIDLTRGQRMTHTLEKFALTLLCVGVAGTLLTAFTTLSALAAQSAPAPGTLKALKAANTAEMNTNVVFNFDGSGHCKLTLNGGNGSAKDFEGDLPFTGAYFYSSASMTSFDAFKDFTATASPSGNCKTNGAGPFIATVRIVNPHPQSAGTPAPNNTPVIAGDGKLSIGMKPGTTTPPVVAATITSVAFLNESGAATGGATVLSVNGTGICKYRLSYVNLDAQGNTILKPYPMMPKSSSLQSPFPMTMTMLAATSAGVYKWTATGVDGCTSTANATLTVQ
jgi:hypothetical protein